MSETSPEGNNSALESLRRGQQLLYGQPPQVEAAVAEFQRARDLWDPIKVPQHWAAATLSLAAAYLRRSPDSRRENYDGAIALLEEAGAVLTERAPDDPNLIHLLYLLGFAYSERGGPQQEADIDHALEVLGAGLHLARARDEPHGEAKMLLGAALALGQQLTGGRVENQERAIEVLVETMRIATAAEAEDILAFAHYQLGTIYLRRSRGGRQANRGLAIRHLQAALNRPGTLEGPEDRVRTLVALAQAHADSGSPPASQGARSAIAFAREAVATSAEASSDDQASSLLALADALVSLERLDGTSQWAEAEATYRRALALVSTEAGAETSRAHVMNNFGYELVIHAEQAAEHPAEGLSMLHQAASICDQLGDRHEQLKALRNLGFAYSRQQVWGAARDAFDEALAVGQQMVQSAWTDVGRRTETAEISRIAPETAYCSLLLGDPDRAFARLETGRATLLGAQLRLDAIRGEHLPDELRLRLLACRADVDRLEACAVVLSEGPEPFARMRQLLAAQSALAAVLREIALASPAAIVNGLTSPELLLEAPLGGALVVPIVSKAGGACFVLPHGRASVEMDDFMLLPDLTTAAVLELWDGNEVAAGWRTAYRDSVAIERPATEDRWHQVMTTTLERLWMLLMKDVDERLRELHLDAGAEVVILPQGGLGVFPLHAASDGLPDGEGPFGQRWTVRYAPSGEVLRSTRTGRPQPNGRAVIVTGATDRLEAVGAEVTAIAAQFRPSDRTVLDRGKANRAAVAEHLRGHAFVHIASHATYGWDDPARCRIQLHGGDSLVLGEISAGLELRDARVVVLSACETGVTEAYASPDEYVGLAGAFLAAGSQAVIASLWAVRDLPTALLMTRFYELAVPLVRPPAVALAEAQRWLRSSTAADLLTVGPWSPTRLPSGPARKRWLALREHAQKSPDDIPFAHPAYWAGFILAGS